MVTWGKKKKNVTAAVHWSSLPILVVNKPSVKAY